MTVIGKINQAVTRAIHNREVRHDVALFVGAFIATGVVGDFGHGAALTWDVLSAAIVVAGRRALAQRLAGK